MNCSKIIIFKALLHINSPSDYMKVHTIRANIIKEMNIKKKYEKNNTLQSENIFFVNISININTV